MSDELFAAGLILKSTDGSEPRWLLLQNAKRNDWGFPKGHRDPGESDVHCALRECAEETGIAILEITDAPLCIDYAVKRDRLKTVRYFPAETLDTDVSISKEHLRAEWCDVDTVLKRLTHANIKSLFKKYLQQTGVL